MVGGMAGRASLVAAVALIAAAVIPWNDFQGHTHWQKVGWIPFVSPPVRVRDIVANTLLFMPLGAAVVLNRGRAALRASLVIAALAGAALSLSAEFLQLYSHTRFPAATDVVCNTAGAALGAFIARGARGARPPS